MRPEERLALYKSFNTLCPQKPTQPRSLTPPSPLPPTFTIPFSGKTSQSLLALPLSGTSLCQSADLDHKMCVRQHPYGAMRLLKIARPLGRIVYNSSLDINSSSLCFISRPVIFITAGGSVQRYLCSSSRVYSALPVPDFLSGCQKRFLSLSDREGRGEQKAWCRLILWSSGEIFCPEWAGQQSSSVFSDNQNFLLGSF
jgi:hypothetical protein